MCRLYLESSKEHNVVVTGILLIKDLFWFKRGSCFFSRTIISPQTKCLPYHSQTLIIHQV